MACGCGCIASDAGGIPEVLEHGRTGFLVPRSNLHRLGEAVLEWLDMEPEERLQIGANARERMLAAHAPAQEQLALNEVLQRLATRESASRAADGERSLHN
jgi:glycosyltransferase involved in cell wall biosynthesis